jgi:hypothetical protein
MKRRWENNIKMNIHVWIRGLNSPGSGQGPVIGFCEGSNKLSGSTK